MRIEHIAMYVHDLEKAKEFFIRYFGGTANDLYHNPRTGFCSYFLTFEDTSRLEIMTKPGLSDAYRGQNHPGYAHIAFSTGCKEKVNALTEQLALDGYQVLSDPRTTGDGYYESCVLCFEGNIVEITV